MDDEQRAEERKWESWVGRSTRTATSKSSANSGTNNGRLQGLAAQHLKVGLKRRAWIRKTWCSRLAAPSCAACRRATSNWPAPKTCGDCCASSPWPRCEARARFHQRAKRSIDHERPLDAGRTRKPRPGLRGGRAPQGSRRSGRLRRSIGQPAGPPGRGGAPRRAAQLEDRTNEEIAHEMKCSKHTVRRILNRVRSRLHGMLVEPSP